jgi:cell wall-associated NlpC family hydrolase
MTPERAIDLLTVVPYIAGRGDWAGADCWGLVELWYRHVVGIELADRGQREPGMGSVDDWANAATGWKRIQAPTDHCLVLIRVGDLEAGHVGIHYAGKVLHTAERHGCVLQSLSDRLIRSRITGFLTRP